MIDLKNTWDKLCSGYCEDVFLVDRRYLELKDAYGQKERYYHNLDHIGFMLLEAEKMKDEIEQNDAFSFAIWYHDAVYNVKRKDNEEKSADLAVEHLTELKVGVEIVTLVDEMIRATKSHEKSSNNDISLLVDIDMAILGQHWDAYEEYTKNIRKEYKIFPNLLYKKGRRGVLEHFLAMKAIYKTEHYRELYEDRARQNILRELQSL